MFFFCCGSSVHMVKSRSHGVILQTVGVKGREETREKKSTQEDFGPCVRGGTSLRLEDTGLPHKQNKTTKCYFKPSDVHTMWIFSFQTLPSPGFCFLWKRLSARVKVQAASVNL